MIGKDYLTSAFSRKKKKKISPELCTCFFFLFYVQLSTNLPSGSPDKVVDTPNF